MQKQILTLIIKPTKDLEPGGYSVDFKRVPVFLRFGLIRTEKGSSEAWRKNTS